MKATIENGELVIRIPANPKGERPASKSGKSEIVASTYGNKTVEIDGEQVTIGVNAYVKISK